MALHLTALPQIPIIKPGDDLPQIILNSLQKSGISLESNDILALSQKIVSKSEDRYVKLENISPSQAAIKLAREAEKDPRFVELVLRESRSVIRTRPGTIIVEHKLGFICASAGIDHSNVQPNNSDNNTVLLLPIDPDRSATIIRERLQKVSGKRLGVLIVDSHGRPWRLGVLGCCIGISGVPGLIDKRGEPDLFGSKLKITTIAAADELAAAASLVMGEANEGTPVVLARGFPYDLQEGSINEIIRPEGEDLFR